MTASKSRGHIIVSFLSEQATLQKRYNQNLRYYKAMIENTKPTHKWNYLFLVVLFCYSFSIFGYCKMWVVQLNKLISFFLVPIIYIYMYIYLNSSMLIDTRPKHAIFFNHYFADVFVLA